jgi:hypothetical protein
VFDEQLGRHDLSGAQRQRGEQCAQLGAWQGDRLTAVVEHTEGPKQQYLHRSQASGARSTHKLNEPGPMACPRWPPGFLQP